MERTKLHLIAALAIGLFAAPVGLVAAKCDTDVVPAATLLFPYFEVDLSQPDNGRTTLIAISNSDREPVLVKVVLWTDWAIPTLGFEIYLAGNDVQTLNLRDLFVAGRLPRTGRAVSPHGTLSEPPVAFTECNQGTTPGGAPVYPDPAITGAALARLRDFHSGRCNGGQRAGERSDREELARGYVTADVVNRCSGLTPADAGYFVSSGTGVAGTRNVLTGDFFFVDSAQNFAQGEQAVHVEAFPGGLGAGVPTFYGRYTGASGADEREPLGTQYEVRHILGGGFDGGTQLIVWRDTGSAEATPRLCENQVPLWWGACGLRSFRVLFDEESNAVHKLDECPHDPDVLPAGGTEMAAPVATQITTLVSYPFGEDRFNISTPFSFGKTRLILRRADAFDPALWPVLQGWLGVLHSAEERFSVGYRAIRLDSACAPAPIDPGPEDF